MAEKLPEEDIEMQDIELAETIVSSGGVKNGTLPENKTSK